MCEDLKRKGRGGHKWTSTLPTSRRGSPETQPQGSTNENEEVVTLLLWLFLQLSSQ